jgi:hypothetical protein
MLTSLCLLPLWMSLLFLRALALGPLPPRSLSSSLPSNLEDQVPRISAPWRAKNQFPDGIPTQPDECDGNDPSEDCFHSMTSSSGGYLWFDKDSQCTSDQKSMMETAVWDATTLAGYSSDFPNSGSKNVGENSGLYYIGPDFYSQHERIAGNLKRAWQWKTPATASKMYITMSCKDTKKLCNEKIDGKSVGGYAWTSMCYSFSTVHRSPIHC